MISLKNFITIFIISAVMIFSCQMPAYAKGHLVDPSTSTPAESGTGSPASSETGGKKPKKTGKQAQSDAEKSITSLSDAVANVLSGVGLIFLVYSVMKMFLCMLSDNPEKLTQGVIGVIVGIVFLALPQFVKNLFG